MAKNREWRGQKVLRMLDEGICNEKAIADAAGVTTSYVRVIRRDTGFKIVKTVLPDYAIKALKVEAKARELPVEEMATKILLEALAKRDST